MRKLEDVTELTAALAAVEQQLAALNATTDFDPDADFALKTEIGGIRDESRRTKRLRAERWDSQARQHMTLMERKRVLEARLAHVQAAPGTLAWALEAHTRVKAEQGGEALTFVRLGDFYESFGADAVTAAAALDLVLTSIPRDGGRVAMAGVPWHAAENYFARLLALGHRVVVVEPDGAARALTAAVAEADERPRPAALLAVVIPAAVFGVPVQLALF